MCCRLTRFLLKIGVLEPLCYPLQIRTTSKGDSIVPNLPKGVVSEIVLLSEPLRLPDLKTAPDFPKALLQKKPLLLWTTSSGGSTASTFPKGVVSEDLVNLSLSRIPKLPNRLRPEASSSSRKGPGRMTGGTM